MRLRAAVLMATLALMVLATPVAAEQDKQAARKYLMEGNKYRIDGDYAKAIDRYSLAIESDPDEWQYVFCRLLCYMKMYRLAAGYEDATLLIKVVEKTSPGSTYMWYYLRGLLQMLNADYVGAQVDAQEALSRKRGDLNSAVLLAMTAAISGKNAAAAKLIKATLPVLRASKRKVHSVDELHLVLALIHLEEGRRADAIAVGRTLRQTVPSKAREGWAIESIATAYRSDDPAVISQATRILYSNVGNASNMNAYPLAVVQSRLGKHRDAFETLRRYRRTPMFLHAMKLRIELGAKLGEIDLAARDAAALAKINPTIRAWVAKLPRAALIKKRMERLSTEHKGLKITAKDKLYNEAEYAHQVMSEILSAVRRHDYRLARRQADKLAGAVQSRDHIDRATRSKTLIDRYVALFDRVVKAIASGELKAKPLKFDDILAKPVNADSRSIWLQWASGSAKWQWPNVSFNRFFDMCAKLDLSGKEWLTLAELAYDNQDEALGRQALVNAWADVGLRSDVSACYAARTKQAEPTAGFVVHRGRLVSPEERGQLSKGLVRYRDEWVTPADRRHLERGHQKMGGKWIPMTKEQLEARGFKLVEGEWVSPEKLARDKGEWDSAWTRETTHYVIKTNKSESFAQKLGGLVEEAHKQLKLMFGPRPKDAPRMKLYAFAKYKDYQEYCRKLGRTDKLSATGFAPSEDLTACGWDKLSDEQALLRTMVHEATHLYFWEKHRANIPSWLAEGMASYFEGFRKSGGGWQFHKIASSRLRLLKQALQNEKQWIPLKVVLSPLTRAGDLINSDPARALVFYAECWGLYYFFQQTGNSYYRERFRNVIDKAIKKQPFDFAKEIGVPLDKLEEELKRFFKRL